MNNLKVGDKLIYIRNNSHIQKERRWFLTGNSYKILKITDFHITINSEKLDSNFSKREIYNYFKNAIEFKTLKII